MYTSRQDIKQRTRPTSTPPCACQRHAITPTPLPPTAIRGKALPHRRAIRTGISSVERSFISRWSPAECLAPTICV